MFRETIDVSWIIDCHNFIHDGRLKALLDKGEVTQDKYDSVMEHGTRVLKEAGIKKKKKPKKNIKIAKWEDWRLVLFGKEYPPIFKDYLEWAAFHNQPTAETDVDY